MTYNNRINHAYNLIKKGKIISFPTETVYGLAADPNNDKAIKKIFIVKNRPTNHPLTINIDSIKKIYFWVKEFPRSAFLLSKYFWPGPLTIIFKKQKNISNLISNNTIGIRIPNNKLALSLLRKTNGLISTSANIYNYNSSTNAKEVKNFLGDKIDYIIDGGNCKIGISSTIIDCSKTNIITILRKGTINKSLILKILKKENKIIKISE